MDEDGVDGGCGRGRKAKDGGEEPAPVDGDDLNGVLALAISLFFAREVQPLDAITLGIVRPHLCGDRGRCVRDGGGGL